MLNQNASSSELKAGAQPSGKVAFVSREGPFHNHRASAALRNLVQQLAELVHSLHVATLEYPWIVANIIGQNDR